jgi:hypothetical protein
MTLTRNKTHPSFAGRNRQSRHDNNNPLSDDIFDLKKSLQRTTEWGYKRM